MCPLQVVIPRFPFLPEIGPAYFGPNRFSLTIFTPLLFLQPVRKPVLYLLPHALLRTCLVFYLFHIILVHLFRCLRRVLYVLEMILPFYLAVLPLSILYLFLHQMSGLLTLYLSPKSSLFVPKIILVVTLIGSPLLDTRSAAGQNPLLTPLGDTYGHSRSGLGYAHPFPSVLS